MDDGVIVWTGSRFDEWDYYKVKELGIPDYAREATQEESALYRQFATALRASAERERELREALDKMTARYVDLVNCGDCGFWNPEEEADVIAARSILNKHKATA